VYKNHPLRFDDIPTFARLLFLGYFDTLSVGIIFHAKTGKRQKTGPTWAF